MGPGFRRDDVGRERALAFSRCVSPELFKFVVPLSKQRAQGMPGARCTRGLMCQTAQKNGGTRAYRAAVNTPTSPAQWLYGLYRALLGESALLSPSSAGSLKLPRT